MPDAIKWCDRGIVSFLSDLCDTMPAYTASRFGGSRYRPYVPVRSRASPRRATSMLQRKRMALIAKKVFQRNVELKRVALIRSDLSMLYENLYYIDPLQFITVGSGDQNRIGSRIQDCRLKLSFNFYHQSTTWQATRFRVIVLRADEQYANPLTSTWNVTPANGGDFKFLFSNDFQGSTARVDSHDYTILADKSVISKRDYAAPTFGVPGRIWCDVKLGNEVFLDQGILSTTFNKSRQVYILVMVSNVTATVLDSAGILQFSGYVYYRDA